MAKSKIITPPVVTTTQPPQTTVLGVGSRIFPNWDSKGIAKRDFYGKGHVEFTTDPRFNQYQLLIRLKNGPNTYDPLQAWNYRDVDGKVFSISGTIWMDASPSLVKSYWLPTFFGILTPGTAYELCIVGQNSAGNYHCVSNIFEYTV